MACDDGICFIYSFLGRLLVYFAILTILVAVSILVIKCVGDWRERNTNEFVQRGETIPLMHQCNTEKLSEVTINYGTCQRDIEHGNCSTYNNCASDLYISKLCVICYDELRNCFFVPCGHRATCHVCAQRIFHDETRNCPICRRYIGKIRSLIDS